MNKLIIVISAQRHGSSYFCDFLKNKLLDFKIQHEIFNFSHFPENINKNPIKIIEDKLLKHQNYGFKLFHNNIDRKQLEEIISKFKNNLLIIFLRRPLEDSYKSLCKSLSTGNWGTTPDKQLQWDKDNIKGFKGKPPIYQEYKNTIDNWFSFVNNICKKFNINTISVNFDDIINKELNEILDQII